MNAGYGRLNAPRVAAVVAALAVALTACGGDPFSFPWDDVPDTTRIYSLERPELNIPTAFSFTERLALPIESPSATGRWDVALDTRDGQLVLLPPGALGVTSQARIATYPNTAYEDVTEAPGGMAEYPSDEPVPVVAGTIYVIRTGARPCSFGARGSRYAKMEPVDIDVAGGSLTFRYITNPICNDRDLVPPD